ncbi:hypothetical protein [Chthonobacter albigriseus]|uniref:hypothetical protein n=1 Tax=Chthonobacter albigriseus TaxID=1683161 RepID=UPI0015EE8D5E|nr:hypothetical protein [Chthonobacter albigriseus]
MDAASIAAAFVASQAETTRQALSVAVMKQQASADAAVVDLLAAATSNAQSIQAAAPPGMGGALDVTV